MPDALSRFNTRSTPQTQRADKNQTKNNAGGYAYQVPNLERLRRFLILGTDGGTYYTNEQALTIENAEIVVDMAQNDHATLVNTILDVSTRGAAPRANPGLFALAIAASHGNDGERQHALSVLPRVARTGTHLFTFIGYVEQFRGWGRGLRNAVSAWYTGKTVPQVAYQAVKYRNRNGWSHRDLLRLSHPKTKDPALRALFDWITHGSTNQRTPALVQGFEKAQRPDAEIPTLISQYGLTWEMLPTTVLNNPAIWESLVAAQSVPYGALVRQLPRLTRLGLLDNHTSLRTRVLTELRDTDRIRKSKIHPLNLLNALYTYSNGRSDQGSSTWVPNADVIDALDDAFYKSFENVTPAGKRTLLALDVSGSMSMGRVAGSSLTPRVASCALAMVQDATEPYTHIVGFTGGRWRGEDALSELQFSSRQRLDDIVNGTRALPFGPTDCSAPIRYARQRKLEIDTFVIYTDSETWAGRTHPHQALQEYRRATGINARMVVVGMTSNGFTIADPKDPGMLDVVGFDTATPNLISQFSRGF